MVTLSFERWLDWFRSRSSFDFINKKNQEKLFKTFDHSIEKKDCIERILEHNETVFLQKSCIGKNVVLFHHLVKVGGSIYDASSVKYGYFHGLGLNTTFPMIPDMDILCANSSGTAVNTPSVTQILGIRSIDDIDGLTVGTTRYRARNFIPVPPFY